MELTATSAVMCMELDVRLVTPLLVWLALLGQCSSSTTTKVVLTHSPIALILLLHTQLDPPWQASTPSQAKPSIFVKAVLQDLPGLISTGSVLNAIDTHETAVVAQKTQWNVTPAQTFWCQTLMEEPADGMFNFLTLLSLQVQQILRVEILTFLLSLTQCLDITEKPVLSASLALLGMNQRELVLSSQDSPSVSRKHSINALPVSLDFPQMQMESVFQQIVRSRIPWILGNVTSVKKNWESSNFICLMPLPENASQKQLAPILRRKMSLINQFVNHLLLLAMLMSSRTLIISTNVHFALMPLKTVRPVLFQELICLHQHASPASIYLQVQLLARNVLTFSLRLLISITIRFALTVQSIPSLESSPASWILMETSFLSHVLETLLWSMANASAQHLNT